MSFNNMWIMQGSPEIQSTWYWLGCALAAAAAVLTVFEKAGAEQKTIPDDMIHLAASRDATTQFYNTGSVPQANTTGISGGRVSQSQGGSK